MKRIGCGMCENHTCATAYFSYHRFKKKSAMGIPRTGSNCLIEETV